MDKRRFSRIEFRMAAELTVNETVYPFAQINNLSVGGCSLQTTVHFEAGLPCRFWLPFEAAADLGVEVYGEIIRSDGESVGVRFTRISPENLFHLQNLVRFNAPDPDRIDEEISEHPGLL